MMASRKFGDPVCGRTGQSAEYPAACFYNVQKVAKSSVE